MIYLFGIGILVLIILGMTSSKLKCDHAAAMETSKRWPYTAYIGPHISNLVACYICLTSRHEKLLKLAEAYMQAEADDAEIRNSGASCHEKIPPVQMPRGQHTSLTSSCWKKGVGNESYTDVCLVRLLGWIVL